MLKVCCLTQGIMRGGWVAWMRRWNTCPHQLLSLDCLKMMAPQVITKSLEFVVLLLREKSNYRR